MRPLRPTRAAPDDYPFAVAIRARFAETDAMGVVHHAAYLPYLESARVEYLRALGHPYAALREEGVDLAVIGVDVSYLAPLRFDDVFDVHVGLAHIARATFAMEYLIVCEGRSMMHGFTRHAALAGGRPIRLPAWLNAAGQALTAARRVEPTPHGPRP